MQRRARSYETKVSFDIGNLQDAVDAAYIKGRSDRFLELPRNSKQVERSYRCAYNAGYRDASKVAQTTVGAIA